MTTAEIVKLFLLLAIFASVFMATQVLLRSTAERTVEFTLINRRLRMISRGADREDIIAELRRNDPLLGQAPQGLVSRWLRNFRRNLMMAQVPFGPTQVLAAMVTMFLVLTAIIVSVAWIKRFALTGGVIQFIIAVSAAIAVFTPLAVVSFLAQRKRRRMQEQFPVALDIFVRALRSGHPIASAIELLTEEMEDPIGSQFGLVSDEVSYGAGLTDALHSMAERWDLDDIRMFVVCLSVQNETGGNLAEILENLSSVIRDRASMYMKVRALSSEGRMTGWMLGVLPIFTFIFLFVMNPAFYLDVATDPIFYLGFPVMVVWYLIGIFMIRRMIDLKV
jgi:tight adherence protein B